MLPILYMTVIRSNKSIRGRKAAHIALQKNQSRVRGCVTRGQYQSYITDGTMTTVKRVSRIHDDIPLRSIKSFMHSSNRYRASFSSRSHTESYDRAYDDSKIRSKYKY